MSATVQSGALGSRRGAELAVLGATATATADIVRDAFGRPVVIDDGDVAPTVQVWGNPGADLPLAGLGLREGGVFMGDFWSRFMAWIANRPS